MDRQNLDLYGCPLFSTPSCKQWTFLVSQTDTVGMANLAGAPFIFRVYQWNSIHPRNSMIFGI